MIEHVLSLKRPRYRMQFDDVDGLPLYVEYFLTNIADEILYRKGGKLLYSHY